MNDYQEGKPLLSDSLSSTITSVGEKIASVRYSDKKVTDRELAKSYNQSWLAGKYIDKHAEDMLKKPREFSGDYDDRLLNIALQKEARLDIQNIRRRALAFASLFGDALVIAVTDCKDMNDELRDDEDINHFIVLTKGEYTPSREIEDNVKSVNFNKPMYYTLNKTGDIIHHSRCFRIKLGISRITDRVKFGTSDLQSKHEYIKLFDTTITCIGDLIQDSNIDVLFIPNLIDRIAAGKENDIAEFLKLINFSKSSMNAIVLDAGSPEAAGRWEQKQANYSGLSDILTKMITVVAGALDTPITVLFGLSASGFSTGEEDLKNYYSKIAARQEERLRPLDNFIDKFIINKIVDSDNLEFRYPSIEIMSPEKEANIVSSYATAYSTLVQSQILTDKIVRNEMLSRGLLVNTSAEELEEIETGGELFKIQQGFER